MIPESFGVLRSLFQRACYLFSLVDLKRLERDRKRRWTPPGSTGLVFFGSQRESAVELLNLKI